MTRHLRLIFAIICAVVFLGVDYQTQSRALGFPLGALPARLYIDSVGARMGGAGKHLAAYEAERERHLAWQRGARKYLPNRVDGWTRYAVREAPHPFFAPDPDTGKATAAEQRANKTGYIYHHRSGGRVLITATTFEFDEAPLPLPAPPNRAPLAVVNGVVFFDLPAPRPTNIDAKASWSAPYRYARGQIGLNQRIVIEFRSTAAPALTRKMAERIDLRAMNQMLRHPVPGVGVGITTPTKQQKRLGADLWALQRDYDDLIRQVSAQHPTSWAELGPLAPEISQINGSMDPATASPQDLTALIERAYGAAYTARLHSYTSAAAAATGG